MEQRWNRLRLIGMLCTAMIVLGCFGAFHAFASSIQIKSGTAAIGKEITVGANGETVELNVSVSGTVSVSKPEQDGWSSVRIDQKKITITIDKNNDTRKRSTSITVYAGRLSRTVNIVQDAAGSATPTIYVNNLPNTDLSWESGADQISKSWSIRAEGGSGSWTATRVDATFTWIDVTTSSNALTLELDPNTSQSPRTGKVQISYNGVNKFITITQQGGATPKNPTPKSVTNTQQSQSPASSSVEATLSVSQSAWTPNADAASVTIDVDKSFGSGDVTFAQTPSWLTVTKSAGNQYTFSVQKNTTSSSRNAQVQFSYSGKNATVSVRQQSVALTVTSNFIEVSSKETTKVVEVSGSGGTGNVTFAKASNASWLKIVDNGSGLYELKIEEHEGQNDREVNVNFSYSGTTQSINVQQTATKLDVSPSSITIFSHETEQSIQVSAEGGDGEVSVNTDVSWIAIQPGALQNFKLNIQQHDGTTDRTANVTVRYANKSAVVKVTQKAARLTVDTKSIEWNSGASAKDVGVVAQYGYGAVTVTKTNVDDRDDWLTIQQKNGGYTFSAAEHEGASDRSMEVKFSYAGRSEKVQVTQKAAKLSVDQSSLVFNSLVGTKNVTVTARDGYGTVSMTKTADWLTVTNNNGTYTFSVPAHTGDSDRSATVKFTYAKKSVAVTVTQKAVELRVNQSGVSFTSAGGERIVLVTANYGAGGVSVSQTSGGWLTVEDIGGGEHAFRVGEHNGNMDQSATVTFKYTEKTVSVQVTQTAAKLTVTPTEIEVHSDATTRQIAFSAEGGYGEITTEDVATWMSVAADGPGRYKVSIDQHTGTTDRTATVTFTYAKKNAVVTVTQKAARMTVDTKSIEWNSGASAQDVGVVAQYGYGAVTVTNIAAWLTIQQKNGGYTFSAAEHEGASDRSTEVTFSYAGRSEKVQVTQKAAKLSVDQSSLVFDSLFGTKNIAVTALDGYGTVSMTETADWLTLTNNNGTYTFSVPAHTGDSDRSTTVTFTYAKKSVAVTVTQKAVELRVNQSGVSFTSAGGERIVLVTANYGAGGVRVSQTSGGWLTVEDKGGGEHAFRVGEHNGNMDRSATVTFEYTEKKVSVQVTQTAAKLTVTPTEIEVHSDNAVSQVEVKEEGGYGDVVVQPGASWLRVNRDYSKPNGFTIYKIDVDANDGTEDRTADVTFTYAKKNAVVTVTQKAARLTVDTKSIEWNSGASAQDVGVVAQYGYGAVTVTKTNGDWLTIQQKNGGYTFSAAEHEGASDRSTEVTFSYAGRSEKVQVTQKAAKLSVDQSSLVFDSVVGTKNVTVTARDGYGTVSMTKTADWLTVTNNNGTYTFSVPAHTGDSDRSATVTFTYAKKSVAVTVTQKAVELRVNQSGVSFTSAGGERNVLVTANYGAGGVRVSQTSGSGDWLGVEDKGGGEHAFRVGEHNGNTNRSATVSFEYAGKTVSVTVTQTAPEIPVIDGFAYVPAGSLKSVPIGLYDSFMDINTSPANAVGNYFIGNTEVTYDLWYRVRTWAEGRGTNRYWFQNAGGEGSLGWQKIGAAPTSARNEPVTGVSWRDVVVWTNAYSEMMGLTPVYRASGNSDTILRDARNAWAAVVDGTVPLQGANGYRLPTAVEWELAARWLGTKAPTDGDLQSEALRTSVNGVIHYWTPGTYASGAVVQTAKSAAESHRVAWYNWKISKTTDVGKKAPNALGMYDVSGHVSEWNFDGGLIRGGSYSSGSGSGLRVGGSNIVLSTVRSSNLEFKTVDVGFRLAKSF